MSLFSLKPPLKTPPLQFTVSFKEQPEAKLCPICGGKDLKVHQTIPSRIKDSVIQKVVIRRMKYEGCHYTFRIYPEGVRAYSGRNKKKREGEIKANRNTKSARPDKNKTTQTEEPKQS